jgi:hypothetical protein
MSAKHGSAGSFRRLLGCAFALVLALSAVFAASASAVPVTHSDLAMGDSLAFGYSQQLFNENEKTGLSPLAFEHGYVNDYYATSGAKRAGIQLQNLGCPGETTDSLIGAGPLGKALEGAISGVHGSTPCLYHLGLGAPLHKEYGAGKSQLEAALETIAVDAGAGNPVTTLTLDIGANDQLAQVHACEAEVKSEFESEGKSKYGGGPTEAVKHCLEAHLEGLIKHILTNAGAALYAIRNGAEFGGINYTGKLVIQGGYDPYGNVFGTGELLPGSVTLASLINLHEGELAASVGGCFANPLPTFNPGGKKETARLQKWTNMANFTEFEGKKNGPDIHPTPTGYHKLALIMIEKCGAVE